MKGRQGIREGLLSYYLYLSIYFSSGAFGFVGQFGSTQGVDFTPNGGLTWTLSNIPDVPSQPRYGAYPTSGHFCLIFYGVTVKVDNLVCFWWYLAR